MKATIELLKNNDMLRVIDEPLDIYLEIPHIAYAEIKKPYARALLFTHPIDKKNDKIFDTPVLMNVYASYEQTKLLFGRDIEEVASDIENLLHMKPPNSFMDKVGMLGNLFALKNVFPKRMEGKGECQQVVHKNEDVNLYDLPVLTTWEQDGGPFITMGQVYTQSLDGTLANLGMYRLQVYDKNHLGMHWQIHKDASHFFDQYKKAGKKMPVSIGIGGDPLYTWCATAPLPYGVNELLLYGFVKKQNARLVKSLTNDIYIPDGVDFVIEGLVDPNEMKIEGPFGDHTGYYTLEEPYPCMEVTAISHKYDPVFLATVVGKPPLEDKYMGWPTERIFLPLLKTTAPDLIDYHMPENGVFHNLIFAKMKPHYKGHAKQFMHVFWGAGQMSFVKHALFIDEKGPELTDYEALSSYILNRFNLSRLFISEGITDALDHSSPEELVGGKLGVDATSPNDDIREIAPLSNEKLFEELKKVVPEASALKQYKSDTKNPISVVLVNKMRPVKEYYKAIKLLQKHLKILVFVDSEKNDVNNAYMLVWRVVNNIDAGRDIEIIDDVIYVDATNKGDVDGFKRRWPDDVECTQSVLDDLKKRGLWDLNSEIENQMQI
ncbi:MAG: menaquinone biosynthesis decarboxylase [Campylobacterota bacterium]|nr:menaquinone biosynthesis decarboxylase [Campylobacterota bacterium]